MVDGETDLRHSGLCADDRVLCLEWASEGYPRDTCEDDLSFSSPRWTELQPQSVRAAMTLVRV